MPPSYSPCPRPILKRSNPPSHIAPTPNDESQTLLAIDPSILSPLVRFPSHTAIAHTIGNALPYDRSPIVVSPNRCALPERGCPGRTYAADEAAAVAAALRHNKRSSLSPSARHLHPRAAFELDLRHDDDLTPRQSPRVDLHPLPPLVPDLSSESSEESDGFSSPPPECYSSSVHAKKTLEHSFTNLSLAGTNAPSSSALSFLPHPPSPRVRPHHSPSTSPSIPHPYPLGLSNTNSTQQRTRSPVRSRSPSSPTSRRKSRPVLIPNPTSPSAHIYPSSNLAPSSTSPTAPVSASPERERRSRHRDERTRESRDRSRERKDRDRAERLARYNSQVSSKLSGFGVDDAGCLGGF